MKSWHNDQEWRTTTLLGWHDDQEWRTSTLLVLGFRFMKMLARRPGMAHIDAFSGGGKEGPLWYSGLFAQAGSDPRGLQWTEKITQGTKARRSDRLR